MSMLPVVWNSNVRRALLILPRTRGADIDSALQQIAMATAVFAICTSFELTIAIHYNQQPQRRYNAGVAKLLRLTSHIIEP
jgi:hypothetical protein